MALINPPSLYTAGAVKVDTRPSINFYAQLMARQQARKDALDQYYQKLVDNTAGQENKMRPQDIMPPDGSEGWHDKLNKWQEMYMNPENKKAILNPQKYGPQALMEFNRLHSELLSDARNSTNLAANGKKALDLIMASKVPMLPEDMDEYHAYDKSMYDKSRKIPETKTDPITGQTLQTERDPDLSNLSINVPDPTMAEKNAARKYATGNITMTEDNGTPDASRGIITFKSSYTPDNLKKIAENYAGTIGGDRRFLLSYSRLMHTPTYIPYNETFKKYYGREIQSPQDMAAAESLVSNEGAVATRTQKWTDPQEWYKKENVRQRNRIQLAGISDAYARGRQEFGHALSQADRQTANLWIDDYIDGLQSKAQESPSVQYKTAKGDITQENIIPLDATLAKSLAKDGIQPDQLRVTTDGNFRPVWFQRDKAGKILEGENNVAAVDNIRSQPISKDQVKLALGKTSAGTKQVNIEMSNRKSYNYNGKTYTQDQIEKGAKHYGLSVDQYLKQLGIK